MKNLFVLIPAFFVALLLVLPKPAQATFGNFNPCQFVPQLCVSPLPSASASPSVDPSPSVLPSESPCVEVQSLIEVEVGCPSSEPSASASATPSVEPSSNPGLTNPGPGGTSGSDGHCTYDPNRSECGGKDPIIPKAAPATGFGPS